MIKVSKTELLYLALSLILIGLFGYFYLTASPAPSRPANRPRTQTQANKEVSVESLTRKLEAIADAPTLEALEALKPDIDKLKPGSQRDGLLARYNQLVLEVDTIKQAEEALARAQAQPSPEHLAQVQDLINKLSTATTKQALQDRLAALTASANAENTPAPEGEAPDEAVTEGVATTITTSGSPATGSTPSVNTPSVPTPAPAETTPPAVAPAETTPAEPAPSQPTGSETSVSSTYVDQP